MHLSLNAGERVFINGAVLRVDRKVGIELLNDAAFLLEGHVLQAEQATTPLRQLYFAAQTMLIEPAQAGLARDLCTGMMAGIAAATGDGAIQAGLATVGKLIEAGRLFEALKTIRGLYPAEASVLSSGTSRSVPATVALRAGQEVPPVPPRKPRTSPALRTETRPARSAHSPMQKPRTIAAGRRPETTPDAEL